MPKMKIKFFNFTGYKSNQWTVSDAVWESEVGKLFTLLQEKGTPFVPGEDWKPTEEECIAEDYDNSAWIYGRKNGNDYEIVITIEGPNLYGEDEDEDVVLEKEGVRVSKEIFNECLTASKEGVASWVWWEN